MQIEMVFVIISEMYHGRIFLNLVLLWLLLNFVGVQVGIDVYVPHHKYQVKSHSMSWFQLLCYCYSIIETISFIHTNRINLLLLK